MSRAPPQMMAILAGYSFNNLKRKLKMPIFHQQENPELSLGERTRLALAEKRALQFEIMQRIEINNLKTISRKDVMFLEPVDRLKYSRLLKVTG